MQLLKYIDKQAERFRTSFKLVRECFGPNQLGILREHILLDEHMDDIHGLYEFIRGLSRDVRPLAKFVFPGVKYSQRGMSAALDAQRDILAAMLDP